MHMGPVKGSAPILCAAIALPEGDVPEWLHLLPAGPVRTVDGRGPYLTRDVAALMTASFKGGKLPLDENHATDLAAPKGAAAPARGWIVELQQRADGIWGRVEWTATGRRMMEEREYRGVSPVILHSADGTVSAILRASLTNTPNLVGLTALHSQEKTMDLRAWLLEALGLSADTADDAIIAAMKKAMEPKADKVATALQSALAPIAAAVGVAAGADAAAILAGVQRLKAAGDENETIVALQSELAEIGGNFAKHIETTTRKDATAFVDAAIAAGRVGVKPMRDRYIAMHMADAANAEALIGAMPIVKGGATLLGDPPKGKDGLSEVDAHVVALMGIDPAAYAATLAAEGNTQA
jgi:phage I-like protein